MNTNPMSFFQLPTNIWLGIMLIIIGSIGFLTYLVDWAWVQSIYEMRIIFIPIGTTMLIYPQVPPVWALSIAVALGVCLWLLT